MTNTRRFRILVLLAAMALCAGVGACEAIQGLFGGVLADGAAGEPQVSVPADSVLLVIDNHSGAAAMAIASFENRGQDVRQTTRILAASGGEATAEVLRTVAEKITVQAWSSTAGGATAPEEIAKGTALARREFVLGSDYQGGDTLQFVIPPLHDCNGNGVPDADDIAAGTSRDCNGNGVPDECDIAAGVGQDADNDGILDECQQPGGLSVLCPGLVTVPANEGCHGVVPALTGRITIVGGAPADLLITQNPQAGSPLTFGAALDVSVVVSDSGVTVASCVISVLLVDESDPILTVPADVAVPCGQSADPDSNPLVGLASAIDNCDPSPAISHTDDTSGVGDCQGQIVRTWLATDESGNTSSGVQIITITPNPPPARIFWTVSQSSNGKIESAMTDRSDRRTHLNAEHCPKEIDVDPVDGQMYWVGYGPAGGFALRRAGWEGSSATTLPVTATDASGVAVDPVGRKLYWTRSVSSHQMAAMCPPPRGGIAWSDLSGAGEELIVLGPPSSSAIAIAVDHSLNVICWTQSSGYGGGYGLYKAGLGGESPQVIRSSVHQMTGVALAPADQCFSGEGKVYWVERTGQNESSMLRANLDGSEAGSVLTVAGDEILNLAFDPAGGELYWTRPASGRIERANLDGSNREDFLANLGPVSGIAVLSGNP